MLFRDYEASGTASLGDLLAFDEFFDALPENTKTIVLRRIKHEVETSTLRGYGEWDMEAAEERGYRRGVAAGKEKTAGEQAS